MSDWLGLSGRRGGALSEAPDATPRPGRLRLLGPFNALLYAPGIGDAVQRLGAALRFEGSLPARTRELVGCAVAAHWESGYEWYAHSRMARAAGVSDEELDQVRQGATPAGLAPEDSAALRLAGALLRDRAVDEAGYADAVTRHGEAPGAEIALLVGYYQALAGLLATVDVPAPVDPHPPPLGGPGPLSAPDVPPRP